MILIIIFNILLLQFVDNHQYNYHVSSFSQYKKPKKSDTALPSVTSLKIDSIVKDAIHKKAFPGCQIYVFHNNKVLLNRSYGFHTYDSTQKVINTDIYDIASVTKVAATTLCIMKLADEHKIKPDDRLSAYLPYLKNTNKEDMTIRQVMAHQAGLKSWIPFFKDVNDNKSASGNVIFSNTLSDDYSVCVASGLYMKNTYKDSIFSRILKSALSPEKKYLYSDLGFYLLSDLIKRVTGKSLDAYADEAFYKPMGLKRITFCPLNKFNKEEIIPTENDTVFRKQQILGYVHDPGAAMLGGVSGHAGLFADASELGKLLQMLLQKGTYNGKQYLSPEVIKEFTRCQYPENGNRRGLGFDKPPLSKDVNGPSCRSASPSSFGHTGFTGCVVWVDPDYDLVYVFLSNRVYPDAHNNKLSDMNIRTGIQQLIYDSLKK